jgi:hypothetical protein
VTASEFAFLALGLLVGVASGIALVVVLRAPSPSTGHVRVTVSPNTIPSRRSATVADAGMDPDPRPARGGPGDRRWTDRDMPATAHEASSPPTAPPHNRTPVPTAPLVAAPLQLAAAGPGGPPIAMGGDRPSVGISIAREPDPMVASLRAGAPARAAADQATGSAAAAAGNVATMTRAPAASAEAPTPVASGPGDGGGSTDTPVATGTAAGDPVATGPCAEERRTADERCAVATRAREGAGVALEALRASQRAYDDHVNRAEAEAAVADPRAVRAAKEAAQQAFRHARSAGRTRDAVEAAARDWLAEINRINQATRDASGRAEKHRVAANEIVAGLERLSVEADAARISAESAEEACVAAREAVAACQEAAAIAAAGGSTPPARPKRPAIEPLDEGDAHPMASRADEDAAIIRILRGDNEVFARIVAQLAGGDAAARQHWQTLLGGLVEALVARAIEASAFDFPQDHPFWSPFTREQCRDIAAALSSLGYRHDGFGGWADEHVPSQRDLSLAVGYAGLDPMRVRPWPNEAEIGDLFRDVAVAADEYLAEAAGGLTLGELVSMLGRRADALTEVWNDWARLRPLLLAGS